MYLGAFPPILPGRTLIRLQRSRCPFSPRPEPGQLTRFRRSRTQRLYRGLHEQGLWYRKRGRGQQEPDLNTREKSGNYVLSPWEGTYSGRRALHGRGGRSLTAGSPSESGLMAGTAADDDAVFAEDVGRGRDLCQGRMIITSRNIPIVRASPGRPPSRPSGLFGHPDKPHR